MAQYLLKMIQPVGEVPSTDDLAPVMEQLARIQTELTEQGSWVFGNGLHQPEASSVVRPGATGALVVDGPYAEGKEFVGGITIIDVADLDAALHWARRQVEATGLTIEVAPFLAGPPGE